MSARKPGNPSLFKQSCVSNSLTKCSILPNFELVGEFMLVLVINKLDQVLIKKDEVALPGTTFS